MRIFIISVRFPLVRDDSGSDNDIMYFGNDSRMVVLQDETYCNDWVKINYENGVITNIAFGDVI